jgi:hypothetical protein
MVNWNYVRENAGRYEKSLKSDVKWRDPGKNWVIGMYKIWS